MCCLLPKLKRIRKHIIKRKSKHKRTSKRRHTTKHKSHKHVYVLFFRRKSLFALNAIARYFYISLLRATNLFVFVLFHVTYIFNAFTIDARSNISHITELFRQLSERKEHHTRMSYMLSVLKMSIRRALLHSSQILPLRKSF